MEAIVKHLYHSDHNSNLVVLVSKQGHLEIVIKLEDTGVFNKPPIEDGKQNAQHFLLTGFSVNGEGV